MDPDTVNTLLNSITALFIAAAGVGGFKVIRSGTDNVATKNAEGVDRIVERLDSIDRHLEGVDARISELEDVAEQRRPPSRTQRSRKRGR